MLVSIFMLTLLSVDRYVAIISSTNRSKWLISARKFRSSTKKMGMLCLSMWILSTLIVLPAAIRAGMWSKGKACGMEWYKDQEEIADSCTPQIDTNRSSTFNMTLDECKNLLETAMSDPSSDTLKNEMLYCEMNRCNLRKPFKYIMVRLTPIHVT